MRGHPVTAVVLLTAYAAAAGLLAPAVLRRGWAARSPRLAMSVWLVLPVSCAVAVVLAVAAALARAFPRVPLFAQAGPDLGVLAEMAADDAAVLRYGRVQLARALVLLARAGTRPASLAAGGQAAIARVQRLLAPPQQR